VDIWTDYFGTGDDTIEEDMYMLLVTKRFSIILVDFPVPE